jgi:nitrite reductase/ring-hydroxylating ferredoxin subunit
MAFVRVAEARAVPEGRGILVEHGALAVAVFNAGDGRFHAVSALCPHEDGPLADGWVERGAVICPWHGFDFDLATGRSAAAPRLGVTVYPVRVRGGDVEVDLPVG